MTVKTGVINEFRGEHFFLSNYYYSPFVWRNETFPTAEHAFAYAKTFRAVNEVQAAKYRIDILAAPAPGDAKRLGGPRGGLEIKVPEWDAIKVQYMREIVHAKFRTAEANVVGPLIMTGACMLVEGNDWNDKFWGRCLDKTTGKWVGLNTLGVILMEERGWWSRSDEGRP